MKESNIEHMGKTVEDSVTGFSGIVTGMCRYLTGCDQYCVTAKVKDNYSDAKAGWYDINRLSLVISVPTLKLNTENNNGAMDSPEVY